MMRNIANRDGKHSYAIGPYRKPESMVKIGESFIVDTVDAFGNKIESDRVDLMSIIEYPYLNPLTGPIFVEDAEDGDTLAVSIHSIEITRNSRKDICLNRVEIDYSPRESEIYKR